MKSRKYQDRRGLITLFIGVLWQISASASPASATFVDVLNELGKSEPGYILRIKSIVGGAGIVPRTFTVMPGQTVALSPKSIKRFTVFRDFGTHSRVYEVSCPLENTEQVTLRLIDIHSNRMRGDCKLTRVGRSTPASGTTWN